MNSLRLLFILSSFLGCSSLLAQCLKGITTNPSAPVNTERPDKTNTFFDWTSLIYNINSQYINALQIDAPFNQTDNSLVNHFLNNQDRLPIDGWELIKYDLGYTEAGIPKTTPVGYIYVVLYNKYTGVLRAFFAGDRPQVFTGAKITIQFKNGVQSSALTNASEIFAIESFTQNPNIVVVSPYNNNNSKWYYADFNIAYDPCTCFYESTLKIVVHLINASVINLTGSLTGSLTNISSGTGNVSDDGFSFDPKNLATSGKKAYKAYKDVNKFKTDQEKALSIFGLTDAQLELQGKYDKLQKRHELNGFQSLLKKSEFLKDGLKAAPYIAGALELVNFFVGGGKNSPQQVEVMPMAINATLNLTGTLEASYLYGDVTFYTPGSSNSQFKNPVDYAYYNEVLGVFNLLEAPTLYSEVLQSYHFYDQGAGYFEDTEHVRYQMAPLKYVVNPASNLRTDNVEIFASLDFGNYKTAYLPLSMFQSMSFDIGEISYDYGNGNNYYEKLGCLGNAVPYKVRLLVNLERNNSDATTQNVLLALSYPIKFSSETFTNFGPAYCAYENEITFQNKVVNYNPLAWNNIIIKSNVTYTVPSGQDRTLKAGSITLQPGAVVTPNVKLQAELPITQTPVFVPPVTPAQIQTFCTSNLYNPLSRTLRAKVPDDEPVVEALEDYVLEVYPNPATDKVTFRYFLKNSSHVYLKITDLAGKEVATPIDKFIIEGNHEFEMNTSSLLQGVYVYTFKTDSNLMVQKLIITK